MESGLDEQPGPSGCLVTCGLPVETFVRWLVWSGLSWGAGNRGLGQRRVNAGDLLPGRPVGLWQGGAVELLRGDVFQGRSVSWMDHSRSFPETRATFWCFGGVKPHAKKPHPHAQFTTTPSVQPPSKLCTLFLSLLPQKPLFTRLDPKS